MSEQQPIAPAEPTRLVEYSIKPIFGTPVETYLMGNSDDSLTEMLKQAYLGLNDLHDAIVASFKPRNGWKPDNIMVVYYGWLGANLIIYGANIVAVDGNIVEVIDAEVLITAIEKDNKKPICCDNIVAMPTILYADLPPNNADDRREVYLGKLLRETKSYAETDNDVRDLLTATSLGNDTVKPIGFYGICNKHEIIAHAQIDSVITCYS